MDPDTYLLSAFKITVEKLLRMGVKYIPIQGYFNMPFVYKHLPETYIPIKMLQECKTVI